MVDGKCLLGTQLLAQLAEDVQCGGQQRQQWQQPEDVAFHAEAHARKAHNADKHKQEAECQIAAGKHRPYVGHGAVDTEDTGELLLLVAQQRHIELRRPKMELVLRHPQGNVVVHGQPPARDARLMQLGLRLTDNLFNRTRCLHLEAGSYSETGHKQLPKVQLNYVLSFYHPLSG